jgi:hypothetical protein
MKILRDMKVVLILSIVILILMLVRVRENNTWSGNIREAAEMTSLRTNVVTLSDLQKMNEPVTLIKLGEMVTDSILSAFPALNVTMIELVKKDFLQQIRKSGQRYVIVSGSPSTSVKAWVILNQSGVANLYMLGESESNEDFKYQFQPDTTVRLELNDDKE